MAKTVLIIACHPDDEVLGCGATVARMAAEGDTIFTAILGEGITSRDAQRDRDARSTELGNLHEDLHRANAIIGVKEVFTFDLPDNRFDSVPLLDIVKRIEELKVRLRPHTIFTHYGNDLNVDHQVAFRAVLTATRPMRDESVREIYSFEVMSSTEWNFPITFSPNVFVDVSSTISKKVDAMACYRSELRDFPHPRSLRAIEQTAATWGTKIGVSHAEAFQLIRCVR